MSEEKIRFSKPEQLGTVMNVCGDQYEIHRPGERLTDSFLDTLIEYNYKVFFPPHLKLFDSNEEKKPVILSFTDNTMIVKYEGIEKEYQITFFDFSKAFIENVKKFAIYYAAPCNYVAFFNDSYDNAINKMNRYRDKEKVILNKLSKLP